MTNRGYLRKRIQDYELPHRREALLVGCIELLDYSGKLLVRENALQAFDSYLQITT